MAALVAALSVPLQSSWPGVALAQAVAPAASDVVKLKDGSMFRGTIMELVPSDHVDITLSSGQSRRFPMRDVAYAGPASGEPSTPPPLPAPSQPAPAQPSPPAQPPPPEPMITVRGDRADVRLEANEGDVSFLVRTGQGEFSGSGYAWGRGGVSVWGQSRDYSIICTAPCDARIPVGTHRLALTQGGGRAIETDDPIEVPGPSTLHGIYESRTGTRVAGWIVLGASVVAGTVVMLTSIKSKQDCSIGPNDCYPTSDFDTTQFLVGTGIMAAGTVVGLVLGLQKDHATIEVVPQGPPRAMLRMPSLAREGASLDGSGLALRYRF
jgi:hypothetical protein